MISRPIILETRPLKEHQQHHFHSKHLSIRFLWHHTEGSMGIQEFVISYPNGRIMLFLSVHQIGFVYFGCCYNGCTLKNRTLSGRCRNTRYIGPERAVQWILLVDFVRNRAKLIGPLSLFPHKVQNWSTCLCLSSKSGSATNKESIPVSPSVISRNSNWAS